MTPIQKSPETFYVNWSVLKFAGNCSSYVLEEEINLRTKSIYGPVCPLLISAFIEERRAMYSDLIKKWRDSEHWESVLNSDYIRRVFDDIVRFDHGAAD